MQQGRRRGIQQGRQQEKVIIAKKLLEHNASFDLIKQTTGLSQKQIEDIAETIKPFILKLL